MKRSILIPVFLLLILLFQGCDDYLDLQPIDELVQEEYWQTREDVSAVLMSAYQQLAMMDEQLFVFGELRGDMISQGTPTTPQLLIMQGNLEPDNTLTRWGDFYKVINYCNYVLEFAPLAFERDPTFTEYQLKGFESEALFLRSLSYFYLVRIFGEVPLVLNSSKTDGQDFFIAKSSEQIVLDKIKEDLKIARLTATDEYGTIENNKGRARKDAMNALLAEISLWQYEYQECIDYCNAIPEDKYVLLHGSQWFTLFNPGNSLESIFELQYSNSLDQPNRIYDFTYQVRRVVASEYAQEILDPQISLEPWRSASFTYNNLTNKRIWKYAGFNLTSVRPAASLRSCNWIIYRYTDVILMKAEAMNNLGLYQDAVGLINLIRTRAAVENINPPLNTRSIENAIMLERAKEFAFEGKRWFDLLRMGRRNNYERKQELISRMILNVPATQKLVLSSKLNDPNGWFFPIHVNELEANTNLTQNPYYSSFFK